MHKASYWERRKDHVRCTLCPHECEIGEGKAGLCHARQNKEGTLYTAAYEKPCSIHIDPIEKKPFYHFLPGSKALSIGTLGCNMFCRGCQNHEISRGNPENYALQTFNSSQVIEIAKTSEAEIIAYTYNEPIIFYEYMVEIAEKARKSGLKNVIVSNGYINQEPLSRLAKLIDGANIDLKGFDAEWHKHWTCAELEPVKKTIKSLHEQGVHVEVTNLLIPEENDDPAMFEEMCKWLASINKELVLHISRFFPHHNAHTHKITPQEGLSKAKHIAQKHLAHVYLGNIQQDNRIICPGCGKSNHPDCNGKCLCGNKLAGVWR